MNRTIKTAAVFGALAVAIGAFGAHGLKSFLIEAGRLDTFKTAVEYQFYHTLALLFIGVLQTQFDSKKLQWAAYAMTVGIILFSGSLYVLCISGLGLLGAITPIGGLFLIAGWVLLILNAKK